MVLAWEALTGLMPDIYIGTFLPLRVTGMKLMNLCVQTQWDMLSQ